MNRRSFLQGGIATTASQVFIPYVSKSGQQETTSAQPNIIMIAVDDCNSWAIGHHPNALTPNLNALAQLGVLYQDCHCPAPMCNGSRTATLTGLQPYHTGVYTNNETPFRNFAPNAVTLPQYFRQNGYDTHLVGKVFHGGPNEPELHDIDNSWSNVAPIEVRYNTKPTPDEPIQWPWGYNSEADLLEWGDYKRVQYTRDILAQNHSQPFFIGLGLVATHTPYYVPKSFVRLHQWPEMPQLLDNDRDDIPPIPTNWLNNHLLNTSWQEIVDAGEWPNQVKYYLASVNFVDYLIGKIMQHLNTSQYADNTIVVIWSDHGYHLGEKQYFGKFTLYDHSTRVPLLFYGPGTERLVQQSGPVGLIDIYPTLCELSGLDVLTGLDGVSLTGQRGEPVICTHMQGNHTIIGRDWKLNHYSDGTEELFHKKTDPMEWYNLVGNFETTDNELRGFLPG